MQPPAIRPTPIRTARTLRRAFTLIEALVATGILLVVFVIVGQVFSISTNASGRVTAQAEMIESAAVFEQAVRTQIAKLKQPGLLIIDSPAPAGSPSQLPPRKDVEIGEAALPLRHDRLVFFAAGGPDEFESLTDRNLPSIHNTANGGINGDVGAGRAYAGGEALVFFGPAFPDGRAIVDQGTLAADTSLTGKEWLLAQRIILLGTSAAPVQPAYTSFANVVPRLQYPNDLFSAAPELYFAAVDGIQETSSSILFRMLVDGTLSGAGGDPAFEPLVQCNFCPSTVTTNLALDANINPPAVPDGPFYRGRTAFNLLPRVADLRIEWTDGSPIDPFNIAAAPAYQARDPSTQWYGQLRDVNGAKNWSAPTIIAGNSSGDVCEKWRWLFAFNGQANVPDVSPEAGVFGTGANAVNAVERVAPDLPFPHYRARWWSQNWQFRPKALRFTFRLYDEQNRFSTEEELNQTPWQNASPTPPRNIKRWGQEFSFVVEVP